MSALAGLVPLAVHAHYLGLLAFRPALAAVVALAVLAATIWLRGVEGRPLTAAAATLLGVAYTAGMLSYGYAIRHHDIVRGYDLVGARHLAIRSLIVPVPP